MNKHVALLVFDLCFSCCAALCIAPLLVTPAYAYVDPSVMTYTIQALAGVAVALSAVFGVLWRKARHKIMKLLGIDENANKIVEPNVVRINPQEKSQADERAAHEELVNYNRKGKRQNKESYNLNWKRRLAVSALVSATLALSICLVGPYEIVFNSSRDLILGLHDIWFAQFLLFIAVFVILALVFSFFKGKAFAVIIALAAALSVGMFIQIITLNGPLPSADGYKVNWDDYTTITCISSAVWLVIFGVFIYICLRHYNVQRVIIPAVCIILIAIQALSLFGTVKNFQETHNEEVPKMVTQEGLLQVNPENNVIVFILDTADTEEVLPVLEQNPERFESFTGFTLYPDSVGSLIPTTHAIPYLLTGQFPQEDDTYDSYMDEVYSRSNFLKDIKNAGYSIGIYSSDIGDYYEIANETINIRPLVDQVGSLDNSSSLTMKTAFELCKCTLYRDLPWILKPLFWYHTTEINTVMKSDLQITDEVEMEPYVIDDLALYEAFQEKRLASTDNAPTGAFRFIHMQGSHGPYIMDKNAQALPEGTESSRYIQTLGVFKIVEEYLNQLKELDVYDDATIIITADHGKWYLTDNYLDQPTSPIMFYKPAQTPEEAAQPLKISDKPVSHAEYIATIIAAVGGNSSDYGITFEEASTSTPPRRYFMTLSNQKQEYISLAEYLIYGPVSDLSNWHLTGREIDAGLADGMAQINNAKAHEREAAFTQ